MTDTSKTAKIIKKVLSLTITLSNCQCAVKLYHLFMITSAKEVMFLPDFVCLCVCVYKITQKSYGRIFLKF